MAFDSFNPTESLIPNDGDLVFDAITGEGGRSPAETVLPYIEQRADPDTIYRDAGGDGITGDLGDSGFVIDWTPGDGPTGETGGNSDHLPGGKRRLQPRHRHQLD